MSPKYSLTSRKELIDNFHSNILKSDDKISPPYFNIDPKGIITLISEHARSYFHEEWEVNFKAGDNFLDLLPIDLLEKFLTAISQVFLSGFPYEFSWTSKNKSYVLFFSQLLSAPGDLEQIQIVIDSKIPKQKNQNPVGISAEKEQQFIFKLIRSLGKANDVKVGLSQMISYISEFLNFDFAEAWEVGYDKNTLFKSAAFSKENQNWDDENIKAFKKGEGLPGITWETRNVLVWNYLQQDERFVRKSQLLKNNISLGIGVPVIHNKNVIAIMTFFGTGENNISGIQEILQRISFQVSAFVNQKITENQLNNMFRFSPNLIAVVGLDGYLKKVNPSFIKIFGFEEDQLLNTPFTRFLHKEDKLPTFKKLSEVINGLRPRSFQNRCLTVNGDYKWISWTPSELMEEEGVVHVFGTDISNIKKTNLELLQYRNIIESSKDGIGLFTLENEEIFFNKAFGTILKYSEEELKDVRIVQKIYSSNPQAIEIYNQILEGNFYEGDLMLMDSKGELLDYHFSGGPIINENQEIIALFGLHRDISERKKYESSLKEYGERIHNIMENITDGFFSLNSVEKVTYWNKAAEELFQIPRDKILGQKLDDFFSEEKEPVIHEQYKKAISSQKKISFEHFVKYRDMWIEINMYPGKDGLSSYFKDISDRKRIEEETRIAQERYEMVSKATREAVYDWDITNNSLQWSNSYYEIYGYKKLSAQSSLSQWEQQIHKEDRTEVIKKLNSSIVSKDSEWIFEYRLIQANRNIAVVLERGYIIRNENGKAVRMIGSLQDITTLKQNERALEELNYQLKKHSSELTQSNLELEQFAYIASHDLQEPLRMVTSFLTLLEKKYDDNLDEKARQYIHFATDGASRMKQIILDLLDYSRIGKLKYDFEVVDVNVMIKNIIKLHENLIQGKNARIEFQNLPVIKAAVTPLQRVLSNLISNSIKYSSENVAPVVKISVKDLGSHWKFSVQDNGIGFDNQFNEKIFIIFQRLHSRDQYSGTGIGLAISKKIVENHGGQIWAESEEGVGSTFHFTIQKHF